MSCPKNVRTKLPPALAELANQNQRISGFSKLILPYKKVLKEFRKTRGKRPEPRGPGYLHDYIGGPLKIGALWTARAKNLKIGNIPQLWVGSTLEQTIGSCIASGCLQLPGWAGGPGGAHTKECYAYRGMVYNAQKSIHRAAYAGKDYRLSTALKKAHWSAKYVRITAIGDPCVITPLEFDIMVVKIHNAKKRIVGFTAGWKSPNAQHMRKYLMASCTNLEEAMVARSMGWNPSLIWPGETAGQGVRMPDGSRALVCKAIWEKKTKNRIVTCNQCGLCGEDNPGITIIFFEHD